MLWGSRLWSSNSGRGKQTPKKSGFSMTVDCVLLVLNTDLFVSILLHSSKIFFFHLSSMSTDLNVSFERRREVIVVLL